MAESLGLITGPAAGGTPPLGRLGKNVNGYLGETIDIASVLSDCLAAAQTHQWSVERAPATSQVTLPFLTRTAGTVRGEQLDRQPSPHPTPSEPPSTPDTSPSTPDGGSARRPRLYLSTGIHGDEPAGPLAMRQLLQENRWPPGIDLWLCPCLNPIGFQLNRRENADGLDLNRQYLEPAAAETVAHIGWLQRQPRFDLCLCLHEDWESQGFYVYELNPDDRPSLANAMVAHAAAVCPIDRSEVIEGRPAQNGVIRPHLDPRSRPQWPEAFFLLTYKTRLSYTLEAPSDFPLPVRVAALVTAVNTALEMGLQTWPAPGLDSEPFEAGGETK